MGTPGRHPSTGQREREREPERKWMCLNVYETTESKEGIHQIRSKWRRPKFESSPVFNSGKAVGDEIKKNETWQPITMAGSWKTAPAPPSDRNRNYMQPSQILFRKILRNTVVCPQVYEVCRFSIFFSLGIYFEKLKRMRARVSSFCFPPRSFYSANFVFETVCVCVGVCVCVCVFFD